MRLIRPVLLLTLLVLAVGLPAAGASARVTIGIADNKADMFSDPRFAALHLTHARVDVPYDAMQDYRERRWLDGWMAGAKAAHVKPLVTFDRSPKRPSYDPPPAQMAKSLKDLRKRYPFVKEFATWNEANINKQPKLVAHWWLALRQACPTCTILGADLLDRGNVGSWAQRFVKEAKRTPKIWGLHNYVDANTLKTTGTRALLKAVKGALWFTETGGVVSRHNGSGVKFPTSKAHAAQATKFLFRTLTEVSPRVQRMYLYNWNTNVVGGTWDSGLVGPDGKSRPALLALQSLLGVKAG
jgi:hypothetical protein